MIHFDVDETGVLSGESALALRAVEDGREAAPRPAERRA